MLAGLAPVVLFYTYASRDIGSRRDSLRSTHESKWVTSQSNYLRRSREHCRQARVCGDMESRLISLVSVQPATAVVFLKQGEAYAPTKRTKTTYRRVLRVRFIEYMLRMR